MPCRALKDIPGHHPLDTRSTNPSCHTGKCPQRLPKLGGCKITPQLSTTSVHHEMRAGIGGGRERCRLAGILLLQKDWGAGIRAEREGAARLGARMWHLSPAQLEGFSSTARGHPGAHHFGGPREWDRRRVLDPKLMPSNTTSIFHILCG